LARAAARNDHERTMSDSIERPPLQPAQPWPAGARGSTGLREPGSAAAMANAEPAPHQVAAMAVLLGPGAVPGSTAASVAVMTAAARGRHATLVSRGAAVATQALAALARSVRMSLHLEDSGAPAGFGGDAAEGAPAVPDAGRSTTELVLPGWLVEGSSGAVDERLVPMVGAKARSARPDARDVATASRTDPLSPPVLSSTAPIVRVRAVQGAHRTAAPKYWTMLRIVSWGVALAGTITLAAAYWLLAADHGYADEDTSSEKSARPAGRQSH
jgi:hypothetical protein